MIHDMMLDEQMLIIEDDGEIAIFLVVVTRSY